MVVTTARDLLYQAFASVGANVIMTAGEAMRSVTNADVVMDFALRERRVRHSSNDHGISDADTGEVRRAVIKEYLQRCAWARRAADSRVIFISRIGAVPAAITGRQRRALIRYRPRRRRR
jgi:hypothetical protein